MSREVYDAFPTTGKKMFVGVEYEGPKAGRRTLFIQGDVDLDKIKSAIEANDDVEMLYFGAGRLSEVNLDTVDQFLRHSDLFITVESATLDLSARVANNRQFHHMLTLSMPGREIDPARIEVLLAAYKGFDRFDRSRVIVKTDTGKGVVCATLLSCYVNDYSGYKNDVLLWEEPK